MLVQYSEDEALASLWLHSDFIKELNMWLSAESLQHEAHFSCSNRSDENQTGAERGQRQTIHPASQSVSQKNPPYNHW